MLFTTDNFDIAVEAFKSFQQKFYNEELDGVCTLSFSSEYSDWLLVLSLQEEDTVLLSNLYSAFTTLFAQIQDGYVEDEDE